MQDTNNNINKKRDSTNTHNTKIKCDEQFDENSEHKQFTRIHNIKSSNICTPEYMIFCR